MKNIGKLKLTQLSKAGLSKRELNKLIGGENCCICGCHSHMSSSGDISSAMHSYGSGLLAPGGGAGSGSAS